MQSDGRGFDIFTNHETYKLMTKVLFVYLRIFQDKIILSIINNIRDNNID
jgi:hypothetical protein